MGRHPARHYAPQAHPERGEGTRAALLSLSSAGESQPGCRDVSRLPRVAHRRPGRPAVANQLASLVECWSGKRDSNPRPSAWEGEESPRSDAWLRLLACSRVQMAAHDCIGDGPTALGGPSLATNHAMHCASTTRSLPCGVIPVDHARAALRDGEAADRFFPQPLALALGRRVATIFFSSLFRCTGRLRCRGTWAALPRTSLGFHYPSAGKIDRGIDDEAG
jgi:hypothetical protein